MLATIEFDNQPLLQAHKIHNIAAHWFLPLEFQTQEAMRPQVIPQSLLSFGLFAA
jgi:hypothetical protein